MLENIPFDIILRTTVVYLCLVGGLLLFGKKELSQLSITDLVFILLISNSVQNAMVGSNSSLEGGLIAAFVLFLINAIFKFLIYRFKRVRKIIEGSPVILIHEGILFEKHLRQLSITQEELMAAIREHGLKEVQDVNLAMMEIDGNISIISYYDAKKTHFIRKQHQRFIKKTE